MSIISMVILHIKTLEFYFKVFDYLDRWGLCSFCCLLQESSLSLCVGEEFRVSTHV